jgi:hypothetical protein
LIELILNLQRSVLKVDGKDPHALCPIGSSEVIGLQRNGGLEFLPLLIETDIVERIIAEVEQLNLIVVHEGSIVLGGKEDEIALGHFWLSCFVSLVVPD